MIKLLTNVLDGLNVITDTIVDLFSHREFDYLFEQLKMKNLDNHKPILKQKITKDNYYSLLFTIPIGLSIEDFKTNKSAICQYLHEEECNVTIELVNNMALIIVKYECNKSFNYEDYTFNSKGEIPIGIDLLTDKIVSWDYKNDPHLLISATSGAGKSVALSVILSYIVEHTNSELVLVDCKYVDLYPFKDNKKTLMYNEGRSGCEETLSYVVDIMNERYKIIQESGCRNALEYNKKAKEKLNPIFIAIEEIGTFNVRNRDDKEFYDLLGDIAQKARASNMYLIITSQSPYTNECLPAIVKNNLNAILGLRVVNEYASRSVCGDSDLLVNLKGKGHGYLITSDGQVEVQCFNIQSETVKKIGGNSNEK